MQTYIVKLNFKTSVRVGAAGIGIEEQADMIHSDTLFSALCVAMQKLYGQNSLEFLKDFTNNPPFYISSCFPFLKDHFFLPRPFGITTNFKKEEQEEKARKSLKEVKWISTKKFIDWFTNTPVDLDELVDDQKSLDLNIQNVVLPRVALSRLDNDSQLFNYGFTSFANKAGYYFLLNFNQSDYEQRIISAINFLGDEGLGSERTSGLGRFTPEILLLNNVTDEIKEFTQILDAQGSDYFLLGLYNPIVGETISDEKSNFDLIERRGWFDSNPTGVQLKRKTVWMYSEGSLFSSQPKGRLVDVTPDGWENPPHRIFRNGVPFTIKVKREAA